MNRHQSPARRCHHADIHGVFELEQRDVPATVWTGAGGDSLWSNPANWESHALPRTGDDVQIVSPTQVVFDATAGAVTINSLTCDAQFSITGGSLDILGSASFNKQVTQSAGELTGTGQINFNAQAEISGGIMAGTGVTTITSAGTWSINTANNSVSLVGRTIYDHGTVTWNGTANLLTGGGAFHVRPGGTLNIFAGANWQGPTGGATGTAINVDQGAALVVNWSAQLQAIVNVAGTIAIMGDINGIFGDIDCDGDVDNADFVRFRAIFNGINPGFDIDCDGDVDSADFIRFRAAFGGFL